MAETFDFVHNFPEHPSARTFEVRGRQVSSSTISVRRVLNKAGCLLITAKEFQGPLCLWEGDEHAAQAAGDGFGQAQIEARIDEVLSAV